VGAVGMMVRLLAAAGDTVIGQDPGPEAFAAPRLLPVLPVLWPPFGRTERYMAGAVRRLRLLRPDLIEVHNRANLALDVARALPGARVTLFLHNDPQAMRRARTPPQRAAILRAVTVVCVSDHLRRRFMAGIPPDPGQAGRPGSGPTLPPGGGEALLLPNAIDLDAVPPAWPPAARAPVFLFVGRVVADKGADAFVRAFAALRASLPGWRAVMIGADRFHAAAPDTPFLRALRPAAEAAGVEMQGYRPHAEVLAAMARAAIVVVPSRWQEPFGLTALEAMAAGAALICAPVGGLPEVAGAAAAYALPDPPGALEAAMLALAQDADRRAALGAAGLARARQFDAAAARARLQALRRRLKAGAANLIPGNQAAQPHPVGAATP
jgi:glycosyltransferase involved in cell wall biosynthesis